MRDFRAHTLSPSRFPGEGEGTMQPMHRLGQRLFIGLLGLVLGAGVLVPTTAHAAAPTGLTLSAASAYADQETGLRVELVDAGGDPVVGEPVSLERRVNGTWTDLPDVTTGTDGRASRAVVLMREIGRAHV